MRTRDELLDFSLMNFQQVDNSYRQAVLTVVSVVLSMSIGKIPEDTGTLLVRNILAIIDKTTDDVDKDVMATLEFLDEA
jgi:hypothetical protein